jgi:hypothetical protein
MLDLPLGAFTQSAHVDNPGACGRRFVVRGHDYAGRMENGPQRSRRAKIKAEAMVEITDEAAVIEAALEAVDATEFTGDGEREAQIAEIENDAVAALGWLVDVFGLLPEVPGAELVSGTDQTVEVDDAGVELSTDPDFAALFAVCRCGEESCDKCGGFQLTPRTTAAVWTVAQILADHGYDDVTEYGTPQSSMTNGHCSPATHESRGGRTRCGAAKPPAPTTTSPTASHPVAGPVRGARARRWRFT